MAAPRVRATLRRLGTLLQRRPLWLLGLALAGAVPGVVWRWHAYAAAPDAIAFAVAQAKGLAASCLLAPLYAAVLAFAALRDAQPNAPIPALRSPARALVAVASTLVVAIVATIGVAVSSVFLLLPGLILLAWLFTAAPIAAVDGVAPWTAIDRSLEATRQNTWERVGIIYAAGHLSSLFATYALVVPLLLAFGGWLAHMEMLQPIDLPRPRLHAVLDGVALSIAHLPLAMLSAVCFAQDRGALGATAPLPPPPGSPPTR